MHPGSIWRGALGDWGTPILPTSFRNSASARVNILVILSNILVILENWHLGHSETSFRSLAEMCRPLESTFMYFTGFSRISYGLQKGFWYLLWQNWSVFTFWLRVPRLLGLRIFPVARFDGAALKFFDLASDGVSLLQLLWFSITISSTLFWDVP